MDEENVVCGVSYKLCERWLHLSQGFSQMFGGETDACDLDYDGLHSSFDHLGEQFRLIPLPQVT